MHYIPVRWNGPDEVNHVVRWLRANDHVARTVAHNAKQFARAHLTDEGRMCYIKVGCRLVPERLLSCVRAGETKRGGAEQPAAQPSPAALTGLGSGSRAWGSGGASLSQESWTEPRPRGFAHPVARAVAFRPTPAPPPPLPPSPQVLFEELAGLYRFSKRPNQYSRAVPVREEIKWFSTPLGKATI